ncbi:MAG: 50S ribosomal protein L23 [Candidatus Taylorbacteria bacterium]|nr:50S ribosomal protein L23 [Candidatus Taylorbacteria bacterium]
MAILNLKKNKVASEKVAKKTVKAVKATKVSVVKPKTNMAVGLGLSHVDASSIIVRPRITEKPAILSEKQGRMVCVFEVTKKANARNVSLAVQVLYKVVPVKVAVLRVPPKKSFVRGHISYGKTAYKAYVYLQAGDKIELA